VKKSKRFLRVEVYRKYGNEIEYVESYSLSKLKQYHPVEWERIKRKLQQGRKVYTTPSRNEWMMLRGVDKKRQVKYNDRHIREKLPKGVDYV
jgi:hypothetical protein